MSEEVAGAAPWPRWYGRRHGHRLRQGRGRLLETLLPKVRIAPPAAGGILDLTGAFGRPVADIWLEVGFGAGEHLASRAARHPEIGFIGCEPFVNGVAAMLARIAAQGLDNVRVFDDDARLLLPAIPDRALGRVFVLFPDPWPKRRHHKRRLIAPATLEILARVMCEGAELVFASDHAGYVAWTLAQMRGHPAFAWTARVARDWRQPPADWVETRYERKARTQGGRCVYLTFRRLPLARPVGGRQTP